MILFKMSKHSDFHLIFFQLEGAWQDFTVVTQLIKNFKSLYGFGGCFLKVRDIYMDFEPYFKVHNLVSVHHKSIILGQMTNLNMILNVVVSVYRLVKIWNSPLFPVEFQNGQLRKCQQKAMIKKPTNISGPLVGTFLLKTDISEKILLYILGFHINSENSGFKRICTTRS